MPVTRQCKLPNLSRQGIYYKPVSTKDKDIELMRVIDEIHLEELYLGSRGMKNILKRFFLSCSHDLSSRKVLSWRLSNTLDVSFWIEALEEALMKLSLHPLNLQIPL